MFFWLFNVNLTGTEVSAKFWHRSLVNFESIMHQLSLHIRVRSCSYLLSYPRPCGLGLCVACRGGKCCRHRLPASRAECFKHWFLLHWHWPINRRWCLSWSLTDKQTSQVCIELGYTETSVGWDAQRSQDWYIGLKERRRKREKAEQTKTIRKHFKTQERLEMSSTRNLAKWIK